MVFIYLCLWEVCLILLFFVPPSASSCSYSSSSAFNRETISSRDREVLKTRHAWFSDVKVDARYFEVFESTTFAFSCLLKRVRAVLTVVMMMIIMHVLSIPATVVIACYVSTALAAAVPLHSDSPSLAIETQHSPPSSAALKILNLTTTP